MEVTAALASTLTWSKTKLVMIPFLTICFNKGCFFIANTYTSLDLKMTFRFNKTIYYNFRIYMFRPLIRHDLLDPNYAYLPRPEVGPPRPNHLSAKQAFLE